MSFEEHNVNTLRNCQNLAPSRIVEFMVFPLWIISSQNLSKHGLCTGTPGLFPTISSSHVTSSKSPKKLANDCRFVRSCHVPMSCRAFNRCNPQTSASNHLLSFSPQCSIHDSGRSQATHSSFKISGLAPLVTIASYIHIKFIGSDQTPSLHASRHCRDDPPPHCQCLGKS